VPLLRCNIVPEFITADFAVVKKQRQKLQCGAKTTAIFADCGEKTTAKIADLGFTPMQILPLG